MSSESRIRHVSPSKRHHQPRTISKEAGVALGTVGLVFNDLATRGLATQATTPKAKRVLLDRDRMLLCGGDGHCGCCGGLAFPNVKPETSGIAGMGQTMGETLKARPKARIPLAAWFAIFVVVCLTMTSHCVLLSRARRGRTWLYGGIDFADALHLALSAESKTPLTFDCKFIKLARKLSPEVKVAEVPLRQAAVPASKMRSISHAAMSLVSHS